MGPKPNKRPAKRQSPATALVAPDPAVSASPDDHLAACVALEESGDKHRAGDPAKAARFYARALEGYQAGLHRWLPRDAATAPAPATASALFDMAYNLSRLQYSITQSPSLRRLSPTPLPVQLRQALASHRRALTIAPAPPPPDVFFNTAQVLVSLGEGLAADDRPGTAVGIGTGSGTGSGSASGAGTDNDDGAPGDEARAALREAVNMFRECLGRQEELYAEGVQQRAEAEAEAQAAAAVAEAQGFSSSASRNPGTEEQEQEDEEQGEGEEQDRWATILEPITRQSLLDTATALLDALAALAIALPPGNASTLSAIEDLGASLVSDKIPAYTALARETDPDSNNTDTSVEETWAAVSKFRAAVLEARFRQGNIDVAAYDQALKDIYPTTRQQGISEQVQLVAHADALIAFAAAVSSTSGTATLRWTRLGTALGNLTAASKLPGADNPAALHIGRGDVELLRFSLCRSAAAELPPSIANEGVQLTLLRNAATYYRGAVTVAQAGLRSAQDETAVVAGIKAAVATGLIGGGNGALSQLNVKIDGLVEEVVRDMVDEGLVDEGLVDEHVLHVAGIL